MCRTSPELVRLRDLSGTTLEKQYENNRIAGRESRADHLRPGDRNVEDVLYEQEPATKTDENTSESEG